MSRKRSLYSEFEAVDYIVRSNSISKIKDNIKLQQYNRCEKTRHLFTIHISLIVLQEQLLAQKTTDAAVLILLINK